MSRKSAWLRAKRARERAARAAGGVNQPKPSREKDITYRLRNETKEEFANRRDRRRWLPKRVNPEASAALRKLPYGAEFTLDYVGFGSSGQSRFAVVSTRNGYVEKIVRVREDGRHERWHMAKTKSQLEFRIDLGNAVRVTIHNGGKPIPYEWRKEHG